MVTQQHSRLIAALYIALIPLGLFGILYVPNLIADQSSTSVFLSLLKDKQQWIALSVLTSVLLQVVQLLLVILLYQQLKAFGPVLALLMLCSIVISVPLLLMSQIQYMALLQALDQWQLPFSVLQQQQIVTLLQQRQQGVFITQFFWGLWLLPLAWLGLRSGLINRWVMGLLCLAGIAYMLDSFNFIISQNEQYMLAHYLFIGELAFIFCLLRYRPAALARTVSV